MQIFGKREKKLSYVQPLHQCDKNVVLLAVLQSLNSRGTSHFMALWKFHAACQAKNFLP